MRQKLITLCPTTFETATGMNNFSAWVRLQLQKYRDNRQTTLDEVLEDLDFEREQVERMSVLLSDIATGKKEWIQTSGWVKCSEEE